MLKYDEENYFLEVKNHLTNLFGYLSKKSSS